MEESSKEKCVEWFPAEHQEGGGGRPGGIPFTENGERDILHREAKIFILGILYLRCMLDIQMDMMNRTLALYV